LTNGSFFTHEKGTRSDTLISRFYNFFFTAPLPYSQIYHNVAKPYVFSESCISIVWANTVRPYGQTFTRIVLLFIC
jgi:hypothetical protein